MIVFWGDFMVNVRNIYPTDWDHSEMKLSLESEYCAAHEAVFELFTGWPNRGLKELPAIGVDSEVKRNRPFFFMPTPEATDFQLFGKEFRGLYLGLRTAIEAGGIDGSFQTVCNRIICVVSLWDAIIFALRGGFPIRKGVQKALKIHQNINKPLDTQLETLGDATKAQRLFIRRGDNLVDPVCKQIRGNRDTTTLKEYLNANSFDKPGKRGRPSRDSDVKKCDRQYVHRAFGDVCVVQSDGIIKYQFISLEKVVCTIVNEILDSTDKESIRQMKVDDFLEKLGSDPVAKLYLKNAPEVVFHFICTIAEKKFFRAQDLLTPRLSEQLKALPFGQTEIEV
jgi:hypothetical protein